MRELTYAEFCELPLKLVWHFSCDTEHVLTKANKETGTFKHTVTRVKRNGEFGKVTTTYALRDDKRTFTTVDQVYVAYMEKACGVTA